MYILWTKVLEINPQEDSLRLQTARGKLMIFDRDCIRNTKLKLISGSWSSASKAASDFSLILQRGNWLLTLF